MARGNGWLSARSLAAFAGGTVTALLASRVLPPLLAQAAGSMEAARGGDPFDVLIDDHRHFLSLLMQMEQAGGSSLAQRMQLLLRLKRRLTAHALAEEDVLYPLLQDRTGESDETRHLYAEHAEVKMHLYNLEQSVGDASGWEMRVRSLRQLIADHARQEETVDFPRLRQRLGESDLTRLSGHLRREKAMVL